jgi:O-antigen/teichoic acid export membrane protein
LRRAGWTLSDQGLTSVGNLLLAVLVARAVPVVDFGAFAIAFAVYLLALGVSRAVSTDALVVRHSTGPAELRSHAAGSAVAAALAAGLASGALTGLCALLASGALREVLLALAVVLAPLLVQDAWRFVFFAAGTPRKATVNDGARIGLAVVLALGLTLQDVDSAWPFVLAWGLSAAGAALLGCVQAGSLPRVRSLPVWWREHKDLSKDFVGEHLALSGVAGLSTFIVAAVAGVGEAAALRGAHVLFGPVNILLMSGTALLVPEGRRLRERAPAQLAPALRAGSALLALLSLVWLLILVVVVGDEVGTALLGESWEPASRVLPAYGFFFVMTGAMLGASVGLRILEHSRAGLVVQLKILPLAVLGAVVGAALAGAVGVALAMSLATGIGAVFWWRAFRRAMTAGPPPARAEVSAP